jgi:hypothetical protein
MALRHVNAEEREDPGKSNRSSESRRRRSARTWGSASHLGLVFATRWAAGTTLNRSGRDDTVVAGVVLFLFLLPRGRPRPRGATGEPRFKREPSTSAMWTREKARKS